MGADPDCVGSRPELRRRHAGVGDVRSRAGRARGDGREERGGRPRTRWRDRGSVGAVRCERPCRMAGRGWWRVRPSRRLHLSAGSCTRWTANSLVPTGDFRARTPTAESLGSWMSRMIQSAADTAAGRRGDFASFVERPGRGGGCRQRRRGRRRHHARLARRRLRTRHRCARARQGAHRVPARTSTLQWRSYEHHSRRSHHA